MVTYKIEHDRANCIKCGACAAAAPDFWEMNEQDGFSDLKASTKRDDGWEEREIEEKDFEVNKQAADACPVNVIHIKNTESEEKII